MHDIDRLIRVWNHATNPSVMRSSRDHETLDNTARRIRRILERDFIRDIDWHYAENDGRMVRGPRIEYLNQVA